MANSSVQFINVGEYPNDGTGDNIRDAFRKINTNFSSITQEIGTISQGVQGIQGITGMTGSRGVLGIQGIQGIQGVDGLFAGQGIQGIQGIQGVDGLFAGQGIQGIQGVDGLFAGQGIQGIQGSQGIQGIQGIDGLFAGQGIQGIQGSQGIQGVDGLFAGQGTQGTQGIQGIQGQSSGNGALSIKAYTVMDETYGSFEKTKTYNTTNNEELTFKDLNAAPMWAIGTTYTPPINSTDPEEIKTINILGFDQITEETQYPVSLDLINNGIHTIKSTDLYIGMGYYAQNISTPSDRPLIAVKFNADTITDPDDPTISFSGKKGVYISLADFTPNKEQDGTTDKITSPLYIDTSGKLCLGNSSGCVNDCITTIDLPTGWIDELSTITQLKTLSLKTDANIDPTNLNQSVGYYVEDTDYTAAKAFFGVITQSNLSQSFIGGYNISLSAKDKSSTIENNPQIYFKINDLDKVIVGSSGITVNGVIDGGTMGVYAETSSTLLIDNGSLNIPLNGKIYAVNVTSAITNITITTPFGSNPSSIVIYFVQDATGYAVTLPTNWYWADGTATTVSTVPNSITRLVLTNDPLGNIHADGEERKLPA